MTWVTRDRETPYTTGLPVVSLRGGANQSNEVAFSGQRN